DTDFTLTLLGSDGTTALHSGSRIISYRVPAGVASIHYLRVEALGTQQGEGGGGTYLGGYVVRASVQPDDDHVNGPESIPVADHLTEADLGTAVIGTIERDGDRDFFSFSLPGNRTATRAFQISAGRQSYVVGTGSSARNRTYTFSCRVFAPDGTLIDDANPGTLLVPAGIPEVVYHIEISLLGQVNSDHPCRYPLFLREVPVSSLELTSLTASAVNRAPLSALASGDTFNISASVTNTGPNPLIWNTSVPLDLALSTDDTWDATDLGANDENGSYTAPSMTASNCCGFMYSNTTSWSTPSLHVWSDLQTVTFPADGNYRLRWFITRYGIDDNDMAELRIDDVEMTDSGDVRIWHEDFEYDGGWGGRSWAADGGDVNSELTNAYAHSTSWAALCGSGLAPGQTSELTLLVNGVASGSKIKFYYRSESVGAVNLGVLVERVLAPAESLLVTKQGKVPEGIAADTYYALGKIPVIRTIPDSDAADNTAAVAIDNRLTVTAKSYPDLAVSNVVVTPHPTGANLAPGDTVDISWTVTNLGTVGTGTNGQGWDELVYLSDDPQGELGRGWPDQVGGSDLAAGASEQHQKTLVLPEGIAGTWYVVIEADVPMWNAPMVVEGPTDGPTRANNTMIADDSLLIPPPEYPNLVVTSIATDKQAYERGENMTVTYTVKNIGTAVVNADFQDRVSLSTDVDRHAAYTYDFGLNPDPAAGTGLQPDASITRTKTVLLPDTLEAIGDRWVVIDVDFPDPSWDPSAVDEGEAGGGFLGGENDNSELGTGDRENGFGGAIRILAPPHPDLKIEISTLSPDQNGFYAWGDEVTVSYRITNLGALATAVAWTDEFYLSTDTRISSADTAMGTETNTTMLGPGAFVDRQHTLTIPQFAEDPASLHLLAATNWNNIYFDEYLDTANNLASEPLTIASALAPDLVVTQIEIEQIGAPIEGDYLWGRPVVVRYQVKNQGTGPVGDAWNDSVTLRHNEAQEQFLGWHDSAAHVWQQNTAQAAWRQVTVPVEAGRHILRWHYSRGSQDGGAHRVFLDDLKVTDDSRTVHLEDFEQAIAPSLPPAANGFSNWATTAANGNEAPWTTLDAFAGHESDTAVGIGTGLDVGDWGTLETEVNLSSPGEVSFWFHLDMDGGMGDVLKFFIDERLAPGESTWRRVKSTFYNRMDGAFSLRVTADSSDQVEEYSLEDNNDFDRAITLRAPALPDLTVTEVDFPLTATRGASFSVEVTIRNQEATPALPTWHDSLALVNDNRQVFSLTTHANGSALEPGDDRTTTMTATLPADLPTGAYQVRIITDYSDAVPETAEDNNEHLQPAAITDEDILSVQACDIVPTAFSTDGSVVLDNPIHIQYTILNQGAGRTPGSWKNEVLFSDFDTWEQARVDPNSYAASTYSSIQDGLAPDAEHVVETTVPTANVVDQNNDEQIYAYLVIDTDDATLEDDGNGGGEDNNVIARGTAIQIGQIDLAVTHPTGPIGSLELGSEASPWHSGGTGQVTWTIQNLGTVSPGEDTWRDRLVVSLNTTASISVDDVTLAEFPRPNDLAPNESYTQDETVTLPQWRYNWSAGQPLYLKVFTNYHSDVPEVERGNNVAVYRLWLSEAPAVDFSIPWIETITDKAGGETFTLVYQLQNSGDLDAVGAWADLIKLYNPVSEETQNLDFFRHPESRLTHEGTAGNWVQIHIPVTAGTHALAWTFSRISSESTGVNGAWIDDLTMPLAATRGTVTTIAFDGPGLPAGFASSDDANGQPHWTIDQALGHDAPGTVVTSEINVHEKRVLTYTGEFEAGEISFWIQVDAHLLDFYLDYTVPAHSTVTLTKEITLPQFVEDRWQIKIYADSGTDIPEPGREGNNLGISNQFDIALPPHPDLNCSALVRLQPENDADVHTGQVVQVQWTVQNQDTNGTGAEASGEEGYWEDRVYLSDDNIWNPGDTLVGSLRHDASLPRGGQYTAVTSFRLPPGDADIWYAFVKTDVMNVVYENDLLVNNLSQPLPLVASLGPFPDLTPLAIIRPDNVPAKSVFTAFWQVENAGTGPATGLWKEKIYLSDDEVLDQTDLLLAEITHEGLNLPSTNDPATPMLYMEQAELQLPGEITGTYYLVVEVDSDDDLFEHSATIQAEHNNTLVSAPFEITVPQTPNLTVPLVRIQQLRKRDNQLHLTAEWTITNTGPAGTGSTMWHDDLYFSTTPNLYGETTWLARRPRQSYLEPGQSYTQTWELVLPWEFPEGDYYLVVKTDVADDVHEHQGEDDNEGVSANDGGEAVTTHVPLLLEDHAFVAILSSYDDPTQVEPADPADDIVVETPIVVAGQKVVASWTAKNVGTLAMTGSDWEDGWALSDDPIYDASDFWLGNRYLHEQALAAGEQDRLEHNVARNAVSNQLPPGEYFLLIVADNGRRGSRFGGNVGVAPTKVRVVATPPPDVLVAPDSIICLTDPAFLKAGKNMRVQWRVENRGYTVTDEHSWNDEVWLSRSGHVNEITDFQLGTRLHTGMLQAMPNPPDASEDWHYTATLSGKVPINLFGDYYIVVVTAEEIYEGPASLHNKGNNFVHPPAPTTIAPPSVLPDLVPTGLRVVTPPEQRMQGRPITLEWTVQNQGNGHTGAQGQGTWMDQVYIKGADAPFPVQTPFNAAFPAPGKLAPDATSTRRAILQLPADAPLRLHFVVWTDHVEMGIFDDKPHGDIYEMDNEDNNVWTSGAVDILPFVLPDLVVTAHAINTAPPILSGTRLSYSYTVANLGGATPEEQGRWTDKIYLSADAILDVQDVKVAEHDRTTGLGTGKSYTVATGIDLDIDLQGSWFVFVKTNCYRDVEEQSEGNNISSDGAHFEVVLAEVPNLEISTIDLSAAEPSLAQTNGQPAEILSGQEVMHVEYTITNTGSVSTVQRSWIDAAFLSRDRYLDERDVRVGYARNHQALEPGASRINQIDFTIPVGLGGEFYLILVADSSETIYERAGEQNNATASSEEDVFTVVLPANGAYDLQVTNVTLTSARESVPLHPGDSFHLEWDVENHGQFNLPRSRWVDAIYLSTDPEWDVDDLFVGETNGTSPTALEVGASWHRTVNLTLPAVSEGLHYLIVRTDVHQNIIEGDETNNDAAVAADNRLDTSVERLIIEDDPDDDDDDGIIHTATVSQAMVLNHDYYYAVDVEAGKDLEIALVCSDRAASTELFVLHGDVPTAVSADYTYTNIFRPDQKIVVSGTRSGRYYILLRAQALPNGGDYSLTATYLHFEVTACSPNSVGNAGPTTFRIEGARFQPDTQVVLIAPGGTEHPAAEVFFASPTLLHAQVDLAGAELGQYELRLTNPADSARAEVTITHEQAVNVTRGSGGKLELRVLAPRNATQYRQYSAWIEYGNQGDCDIPAPLLYFRATGNRLREMFPKMRLNPADEWSNKPLQFLGINRTGPADRLPPGSRFRVQIAFKGVGVSQFWFGVRSLEHGDEQMLDWGELDESVQEEDMSLAANQRMLEYLHNHFGTTYTSFANGLRADALRQWRQERPTFEVGTLLRMAVRRGYGEPGSAVTGFLRVAPAGVMLGNVRMALHSDIGFIYAATTAPDGKFVFRDIAPTTYRLIAEGYELDPPITMEITPDTDRTGLLLEATPVEEQYPLQAPADDPGDQKPNMTADAAGNLHLVWCRGGVVWHAFWAAGTDTWNLLADEQGAPIPEAIGRVPRIVSHTPADSAGGVLVVWEAGLGQDAGLNAIHLMSAFGRPELDDQNVPTG
ncbi:MAG: hypothetical protein KAI66_08925, partial [Lentisphaeria bacterium]|nr:hypothetical protein [Lentisphaeria bacterium]